MVKNYSLVIKTTKIIFLIFSFANFSIDLKAQCTNATQSPATAQVIPTTGAALSVSTNTTDYFLCTVLSGKTYLVYSNTGSDAVTVWGTSNGTGNLGFDAGVLGYVATAATTGTSIWVDLNRNGTCSASVRARTATVELLPYNITLPGGTNCTGTTITITGNALSLVNLVTFTGGATAVPTAVTATSFNVVIPASATTGPITLQTSDGTITYTNPATASSITITPGVTVSGYSPVYGPTGTVVTVTGTNFTGASNVQVNGTAATGVTVTATQITLTVGAGTTTGNITFTSASCGVITVGVFTVGAITNYYYVGAGALTTLTNWGTNTNGTGATPANFTTNGQRFNIRNTAAVTLGGAWTVSGTGAGVIVGDGSTACNFTIPAASALTGSILNVNANATLTLQNNTLPTLTSCVYDPASTVNFANSVSTTIPLTNGYSNSAVYGNLTISGTGTTYSFIGLAGGGTTYTISGTLNISTANTVVMFGGATNDNSYTLTVGNYTQSNGTVDGGPNNSIDPGGNNPAIDAYVYVTGTFNKTGGTLTDNSPSNISQFIFNSGATQNFSLAPTTAATNQWWGYRVSNNTTVTLNTNLDLDGGFGAGTQNYLIIDAGSTFTAGTNLISTNNSANQTTIVVNGKLQTSNTAGLSGGAATTITNATAITLTLGAASTIEYNSGSAQVVTALTYANVIITNNSVKTAAGACTFSGALTINATATFAAGNFTHNIAGNFINNGTFTSNNSTFNFTPSTNAQTISGTSTTSFHSFTLNNSLGVTLSAPINVSTVCTLTSGLFNTDATNILTMKNGSTFSPATFSAASTSYINGPMMYQLASITKTNLWLPIGSSPDCRPALLTIQHTTTRNYNYTIQVFDASAMNLGYTMPATVDTVSGVHYYTINRTDSTGATISSTNLSGNQTVQLFYGANDNVVNAVNGKLTIVKNTSGAPTTWIDIGGTNAAGSVTSTSAPSAFNSFSTFALGNKNNGGNPLPIELLSFTAVANADKVDVKWETITETNNAYFTIEKSKDGINFTKLIDIPGAGNSTSYKNYAETDYQPYEGTSYYRLKQTDNNGKFKYFNMVPVTFVKDGQQSIVVFPNPMKENTSNLNVKVNGYQSQEVVVVLRNAEGKEFLSKILLSEDDNHVFIIDDAKSLPAGSYIITASSNNKIYNYKLIIK
ncbi:MAG: T9SS type A sorting domain-containing protein [Bacteroidia bacterium]